MEIQTDIFIFSFWCAACLLGLYFQCLCSFRYLFNKTLEKVLRDRGILGTPKGIIKISPVSYLCSFFITKSCLLFSSGLTLGHIAVMLFCFFSQGWCFWKVCHGKGWGNVMRRSCSRALSPNSLMHGCLHDEHLQVLPLFHSCIFLYFRYYHAMFCWYQAQKAMKSLLSHLDFTENVSILRFKEITYKFNTFFEKEQIPH